MIHFSFFFPFFFSCSVKPGVRFREVGEVINRHASMSGLSVVSMIQNSYSIHVFLCAVFLLFVSGLSVVSMYASIDASFLLFKLFIQYFFFHVGKILLWPWYWRTVSLCPKYSSLWKYPYFIHLFWLIPWVFAIILICNSLINKLGRLTPFSNI